VGREAQAQRVIERYFGEGYGITTVVPEQGGVIASRRSGKLRELFVSQHRVSTLVASTLFFLPGGALLRSQYIHSASDGRSTRHGQSSRRSDLHHRLSLGSVGGFLVVDWIPRRRFVIGSFAVTSLALLISTTVSGRSDGLVILSFAVFSCVLSAAQAQIYVYLPELFPTSVRASGLGIAVAVSRLGAAAGTSLLPLCVLHFGSAWHSTSVLSPWCWVESSLTSGHRRRGADLSPATSSTSPPVLDRRFSRDVTSRRNRSRRGSHSGCKRRAAPGHAPCRPDMCFELTGALRMASQSVRPSSRHRSKLVRRESSRLAAEFMRYSELAQPAARIVRAVRASAGPYLCIFIYNSPEIELAMNQQLLCPHQGRTGAQLTRFVSK